MTDEYPAAKRLTEELWVKLVDLPGFREWAEEYDRLERVIPNLEEYHLLVHPRDIENPPHGYFEQVFQRQLDAVAEHFAHRNVARHSIGDYKQGGKFYENA